MWRVLRLWEGLWEATRGPQLVTLEDAGLWVGERRGGEVWVAGASRGWMADAGSRWGEDTTVHCEGKSTKLATSCGNL